MSDRLWSIGRVTLIRVDAIFGAGGRDVPLLVSLKIKDDVDRWSALTSESMFFRVRHATGKGSELYHV